MNVIHQILFQHVGADAGTPRTPIAVWAGQVDLTEQVSRCISYENDMQTQVDLYEVRPIALPDWLRPEEWIAQHVQFGYAWARGLPADAPEGWARRLMQLEPVLQYACYRLLAVKNFRSEFRKSLRLQLESWLNGNSEYDRPFSDRQIELLVTVHDSKAVKRIDDAVYHSRRCNDGVVPVTDEVASV